MVDQDAILKHAIAPQGISLATVSDMAEGQDAALKDVVKELRERIGFAPSI